MDGENAVRTISERPLTGGPLTGGTAPGPRRISAEVWEARRAARELLTRAAEEARLLRAGAAGEVARARAQAVESGHAEGLARAAAQVVRGAAERDRLLAGCAGELIGLAAEMAGRILAREVRPGGDALAAAGRALAELRGSRPVALRVSAVDAEAFRAGEADGGFPAAAEGVIVVTDPDLAPGEVIVEADGTVVDGRFRSQLAALRRAVDEGAP
jgi:flagellar biosynthesis/type III secretory pathway protein FliH